MALINLLHFCYVGIGGNKLCGWGDEEEEVGRDGGAGRSDGETGNTFTKPPQKQLKKIFFLLQEKKIRE